MGSTASATQNVTPVTRPLFRRINLPVLKRCLEKIETDIRDADFATWPQVDQATGVVWREDGLVVSRKPIESPHDIVWVIDWEDIDGWAMIVGEFCKQFQVVATKAELNASRGRRQDFFSGLAARIVAPSEENSVLAQLVEQAYRVAEELDRQHVEQLKKDADMGDIESQFLLFEVYGEEGSKYYDNAAAEKLLFSSAQSAFPDACAEVFAEYPIRSDKKRRRLLNSLRELGASGDQQACVLWAKEILDDSQRMESGKCRYPDLSGSHAIVAEAVRLLKAASRAGNGDATWALFLNEADKDNPRAGKYLRLAAKQSHPQASYVLACSLMSGAHGQLKNLRKAHRAFQALYQLSGAQLPGEVGQGLYLWAYACMEMGITIPKELSSELGRVRDIEDYFGGWSHDLLDAIRAYAKSRKTDLFNNVIFEASDYWMAEGPMDEDGNEPGWDEFYQSGTLNIWRGLAVLTPADCGDEVTFDRILSVLRSIADKNVHVVQYILGLMGDTSDDWLGRASDGGFALASYHLGFTRYATEPEAALRHLNRVAYQAEENIGNFPERFKFKLKKYDETKEIVSEEFFHEIRDNALARIRVIETQLAEENARRQTERDMLAYLSHTLNNLFASAPETARQAMRILGSDLYENNRQAKAINNIATMFSTFLFAQKLMKTFSLYIADPVSLRKNWERDQGGNSSITVVLAHALRQTLSQIVFASNHQTKLQRLLPYKEVGAIKEIRKSFMEEMVPLDIDAVYAGTVLDWVAGHIPALQINIDPAAEINFFENSTRFTFFFASFSELIYNALKYSDATNPIQVSWKMDGSNYVFRCCNSWSAESMNPNEGTQKGLVFLTRLVEMLGATLTRESFDRKLDVSIQLPIGLVKDGT